MGDLHLAPEQMHLFDQARAQLVQAMSDEAGKVLPGQRHTHQSAGLHWASGRVAGTLFSLGHACPTMKSLSLLRPHHVVQLHSSSD